MKVATLFALVSITVRAASLPDSNDWVSEMRRASNLDQAARYSDAQEIYDRILPIVNDKSKVQETDVLRAEFLNDMAAHDHRLGRYGDAETLYQQSVAIWRQATEAGNQRDLALTLGNLAALRRAQGQFPAAES